MLNKKPDVSIGHKKSGESLKHRLYFFVSFSYIVFCDNIIKEYRW